MHYTGHASIRSMLILYTASINRMLILYTQPVSVGSAAVPRDKQSFSSLFRVPLVVRNNHPASTHPPWKTGNPTSPTTVHPKNNAHFQILYRPQRRLLPQRQIRRLPRPLSIQTLASRRGIRPFLPCPNRSRPLCRSRELEPGSRAKAETKEQAQRRR